jgi:alpha-ketoglutarate-dependent taurine dioxygenase
VSGDQTFVVRTPVAWDGSLATKLDQLRVDASGSIADLVVPLQVTLRTYGFALLHSLNTNAPAMLDARLEELGSRLGRIVAQSPRGELIEDVRDMSDLEDSDDRGYRSGGELSPHSDPPTLIVLHCVVAARAGGESHLVNVAAICERIAAQDPDSLAALHQPFPAWRIDGEAGLPAGPHTTPIPVLAERNGIVSCVLYRPFTEKAAQALGVGLTAEEVAALDSFDRFSHDPALSLRFTLAPGETLILGNRAVLHARTDYQDWPEVHRRRHLKRLWIDAPHLLPVHPVHELGDIFAIPEGSAAYRT